MDSAAISMTAVSSSFSHSFTNPKFSHFPNPKPAFPPIVRCIHSQSAHLNSCYPLKPVTRTVFSCSAVTSAAAPAKAKVHLLIQEFQSLTDPVDRVKRLLHYAELLSPFDNSMKIADSRVPGCTAQVWLHVKMDDGNRLRFLVNSDSEITKGFCACLVRDLDGATAEEVLAFKAEDFGALSVVGLNGRKGGYSSSRANTWHNVLMSMQKRTKALVAEREGCPFGEPFQSLIVTADGIQAKGSYAEAHVG